MQQITQTKIIELSKTDVHEGGLLQKEKKFFYGYPIGSYGRDAALKKNTIRARLYVELTDRFGYQPYEIEISRYKRVGNRYVETDIILTSIGENRVMYFAVCEAEEFEIRKEEIIKTQLYDVMRYEEKKVDINYLLVCYTQTIENDDFFKQKCIVINYNFYPTFKKWVEAGKPNLNKIPNNNHGPTIF